MKIGICSTHSTGKTTMATNIRNILSIPMIKEVARSSPLIINEEASPVQQLWIFSAMLQKEVEFDYRFDDFVCDRTLLDNYAYMAASLRAEDTDLIKNMVIAIGQFLASWIKTYDIIIYLAPDIPMVDDGVRSTDKEYQLVIDEVIKQLLDGIKYYKIEGERREELMDYMYGLHTTEEFKNALREEWIVNG